MNFLRSVIADARPRKLMRAPLDGPSAITGRKSRALDGNDLGAEQKSSSAAHQTSHLSKSLSTREGASGVDNASTIQVDNPLNQGIPDMGSNVELESPRSVPMDESEPIPSDESPIHLDPVNLPEQPLDSEGDGASEAEGGITPQPANAIISNSRMNSPIGQDNDSSIASPETQDAQNRVSGHEGIEPVSVRGSLRDTSAQEEVAGVIATDDLHYADGSIQGSETLTVQADATQKSALSLPDKNRQMESSGLEASLASSFPSVDSLENPTSDNIAKRNEAEKALANGGKAHQVSPSVDKQAHMKSRSNQERTPQAQNQGEAKGVLRDVQPVSQPAEPLASPEALRSVPARPFQTEWMPKDGSSFHSRPALRSPEKKHEAPKVQIGQIDVIVETAAQPATKPVPAPSPIDLASRHYLRRL